MDLRGFFASVAFPAVLAVAIADMAFADDLKVVSTGIIVGAVTAQSWHFSREHSEGFWTPTPEDVATVESRLRGALEKGVKDPATIMPGPFTPISRQQSAAEIGRVLELCGKSRRQYFGLLIGGKRFIYLNCFPAVDSFEKREKRAPIYVEDGGAAFWRVLYSVEGGVFSKLSVNGEA